MSRESRLHRVGGPALLAIAVMAQPACESNTRSAVGTGAFSLLCSEGDALCEAAGNAMELPSSAALGSSVQVVFKGDQATVSAIEVVPVSPIMAARDGLNIILTGEGYCGLLARSTAGTVVDLVHVRTTAIAEMKVVGPENLVVGQSVELRVEPHGPDGERLGGTLLYEWTTADPSIVAIDTSAHGNRVKVLGVSAGTVAVTAKTGSLETVIALTIGEAP